MPIKNIMVAVAGGAASIITAKYAIYLARVMSSKLTAVYVVNEQLLKDLMRSRVVVDIEAKVYEKDLEEQGKLFLERIKKAAETKKIEFESMVLRGMVHEEIIKKAQETSTCLLVMGNPKEITSRKEVFSDEGELLFREAKCPVVIVKNPEEVEKLYKEIT